MVHIGFSLLMVLVGIPAFAQAQGSIKLDVGHFSAAAVGVTLPEGWTPQRYGQHARAGRGLLR